MSSAPTRLLRPDFRAIFQNLSDYDKEACVLTMDSTYDIITKAVDDKSLDESDTARLVQKYMTGVRDQSKKCFEAIMGAIWPPPPKHYYIIFDGVKITNTDCAPSPKFEEVEHALGIKDAKDVKPYKVFRVVDSRSTIAMDDDHLIIEKEGRAVPLLGQLYCQLPIAHSGGSCHKTQNATTANPSDAPSNADTAKSDTQASPLGDPSTSDPPGLATGNSLSQPSGTGRRQNSLDPPANNRRTRNIGYFPIPNGRRLKRSYAFTEFSPPGAQTVILGPPPPPNLPPHVRTSTLPPGHPPQSYGPGASLPPDTSSGVSNSGSVSNPQLTVSAQSPDSSAIVKKQRSCDD